MPPVIPLSSTDSRAISSASRSISSPSRTKNSCTLRRRPGAPGRECGLGGAHGVVDVVGPGQRHRALDLAGRREDVVVHASRTARTCLAADVQVHLGNGEVDGHRCGPPLRFGV